MLVFWETTRACGLSCVHCRASAIPDPLPGELTPEEGLRVVEQVAAFGPPRPVLVLTGGDPLRRRDLLALLRHARDHGVRTAVSPAATELLTAERLAELRDAGVISVSLSLDGASEGTHDRIRQSVGTYRRTVDAARAAVELGIKVQINTAVLRPNVSELPAIFHQIRSWGVSAWELFFLVRVGRATAELDPPPDVYEGVCRFLVDASQYGVVVRSVEAPFLRRVALEAGEGEPGGDPLYRSLRSDLLALEGAPRTPSTIGPRGTLDGDGILFVGHDGTVQPGGLLPLPLGNVRGSSLVSLYRQSDVLRNIRARRFHGPCSACTYRDVCGGSRARAYARHADPLASDPGCLLAVRGVAV